MTNNNCKHLIGLFHDYDCDNLVTLDDLIKEQPSTNYTMEQYLDRRCSTNLYRFNNCPICGEKIEWKKFKNELFKNNN